MIFLIFDTDSEIFPGMKQNSSCATGCITTEKRFKISDIEVFKISGF